MLDGPQINQINTSSFSIIELALIANIFRTMIFTEDNHGKNETDCKMES